MSEVEIKALNRLATMRDASRFGADVKPRPFRPVLRGLLLSEDGPNYLRAEIAGGAGDDSEVSRDPLWWPPGKIMGRYLSPYLAGSVLRQPDILAGPELPEPVA